MGVGREGRGEGDTNLLRLPDAPLHCLKNHNQPSKPSFYCHFSANPILQNKTKPITMASHTPS